MADRASVLEEWIEEVRSATGAPAVLAAWRDHRGALAVATPGTDPGGAFRIASVTKTFVAAAVLRLVEAGRLHLETPLPDVLGADSVQALREGRFPVDTLTVDHLLAHTSGLVDHASHPSYVEAVLTEPGRSWTRNEQVRRATESGPLAPPDTVVSYSDTGYVLLGEVLERATGDSLGTAVRELVGLDRLGLTSTWWEVDEAELVPRVEQLVQGMRVAALNATLDLFGGGGLVSTTLDLARFFEALVGGEVLGAEATRLMLSTTPLPGDRPGMGRGTFREEALGRDWWSHGGFWGVYAGAGAAPDQALGLCLTEHDAMVRFDRLPAVSDLCRRMSESS